MCVVIRLNTVVWLVITLILLCHWNTSPSSSYLVLGCPIQISVVKVHKKYFQTLEGPWREAVNDCFCIFCAMSHVLHSQSWSNLVYGYIYYSSEDCIWDTVSRSLWPIYCSDLYYRKKKKNIHLSWVYLLYLIVPRLFEEKWRDTVFGFPWGVVRGTWHVVRGAWCMVPSF